MRPRQDLNSPLEVDIIPREGVHNGVDNFLRERRVEHQGTFLSFTSGKVKYSIKEGLVSVVPADVVRNRVGDPDVLEATGGNLEVVIWVTPRP